MDEIIKEIVFAIRANAVNEKTVGNIVRTHNTGVVDQNKRYAKKHLMPYFLAQMNTNASLMKELNLTETEQQKLLDLLRIKPRRTTSGVATITVITKPHPCSSNCIYCPNDIRMPKSYMHNEPACQRAERNFFDPYLQVSARLKTLTEMGHPTDKIELIVLGGTFNDYPQEYQTWYITRLFSALNEAQFAPVVGATLSENYEGLGLTNIESGLEEQTGDLQAKIDGETFTYNDAYREFYAFNQSWNRIAAYQKASLNELYRAQKQNETALHRVVGLVIETRPDLINEQNLIFMRKLGCTKIQMGIQSLNEEVLAQNKRNISFKQIKQAFELLRAFGFKSHTHFMVNLYGQTPETDKEDFKRFVNDAPFQPDEIKLYPVALMANTPLVDLYNKHTWAPYDEQTLVDVLVDDLLNTPCFTRISRMIRDFSAPDIQAGNRKTNLRQMVEDRAVARAQENGIDIQEMRFREINQEIPAAQDLELEDVVYKTSNTTEHFLQWITHDNKLAGFLRLSLIDQDYIKENVNTLPIGPDEAMIREVHVYGRAAVIGQLEEQSQLKGAQHRGLGKELIAKACAIARESGYSKLNVISSVGTRAYYAHLGFSQNELYQQKQL